MVTNGGHLPGTDILRVAMNITQTGESSPLGLAQVDNGLCIARPLQERIILMRKEGDSAKSINEMLLSRLSRYRASPSATLAALTGSTISNTLKEDQAGKGQIAPRNPFFLASVASLPKGTAEPSC